MTEEGSLDVIFLEGIEESSVLDGASNSFAVETVHFSLVVEVNEFGKGNVDEGQMEDLVSMEGPESSHLGLEPGNLVW